MVFEVWLLVPVRVVKLGRLVLSSRLTEIFTSIRVLLSTPLRVLTEVEKGISLCIEGLSLDLLVCEVFRIMNVAFLNFVQVWDFAKEKGITLDYYLQNDTSANHWCSRSVLGGKGFCSCKSLEKD